MIRGSQSGPEDTKMVSKIAPVSYRYYLRHVSRNSSHSPVDWRKRSLSALEECSLPVYLIRGAMAKGIACFALALSTWLRVCSSCLRDIEILPMVGAVLLVRCTLTPVDLIHMVSGRNGIDM